MANRVFQNVVYQMKDAVDRVVGVIDETGTVISCSELGQIGEVREGVATVRHGGLKVNDPAIDLAVISAILSSNMDAEIEAGVCMAGEVGLSGEIRPVNRIEQRISEAEKLGFQRMLIPKHNLSGIDRKKIKIELIPVRKVEEAFRELFG